MAIIQTTNKVYSELIAYENVIKYAANLTKCQGYTGGSSADLYNPASAIRRMKSVYNTYGLMYDKNISKLVHFYISFPPYVKQDKAYKIVDFLKNLCEIVGREYQCFWGLHILNPNPNSTDATHIHFVINRISYINGKYLTDAHIMSIRSLMFKLLEEYDIEQIP